MEMDVLFVGWKKHAKLLRFDRIIFCAARLHDQVTIKSSKGAALEIFERKSGNPSKFSCSQDFKPFYLGT